MTLETGTLLNNRYRIVDILGQGGMGSVYRATDENLGMEVAVKENLFTTEEYSRQFRLEAVILASLRHTNLPRVTDHYVIPEQGQYLVMDYIEGEDLRQRMERMGTISEEDAILIGASICDALAYLHTRKPPVLHRDIKPGNVKITPDGHVYLVDFGLAKLIQGSQTTTTGARAMTPGYSPPEQYGTARTDPRSDIYSLGATLYAALTGTIPEDGLARVMDNLQLTPIRKHNANVSRRLASVIEKAMEAYPDDRYQNADEFRRSLLSSSSKTQRLLEMTPGINVSPPPPESERQSGENPMAPTPSTPIQAFADSINAATARFRRRSRKFASAGIWLGAILLLLSILVSWQSASIPALLTRVLPPSIAQTYVPAPTPTATTQLAVIESTPQPVTETPTPPTPTETLSPSPTPAPTMMGGSGQIAFVSERTGIPQIYIINADGSGLRPVTNEQDGACQPDWSPDGTKIVYIVPCRSKVKQDVYENSSMFIINVDGTGRTALPVAIGGDFDPAWSPDGKRIAFTSLRNGAMDIYVIELENNMVTQITDARKISSGYFARYPAWDPFGTQIAYTFKRGATTQIWVTTSAGINVTKPNDQLVQSGGSLTDYQPSWSPDGTYVVFNQTNSDGTAPAWLMRIRYEDRLLKQAVRVPIEPPPVVDANFSPDGYWLAFESWPDDSLNQDIYIATITGANRQRLTTDPGVDFDPVWRPLPKTPAP
jgi:serine/threonine protein kinase